MINVFLIHIQTYQEFLCLVTFNIGAGLLMSVELSSCMAI